MIILSLAGLSLTELSLAGNYLIFPGQEEFDNRLGTGKSILFFYSLWLHSTTTLCSKMTDLYCCLEHVVYITFFGKALKIPVLTCSSSIIFSQPATRSSRHTITQAP
jgi:hypothetical protein